MFVYFLGSFIVLYAVAQFFDYLYHKSGIEFFSRLFGIFNFLAVISFVIGFIGMIFYGFTSDSDCYIPYYGTEEVCD